MTSVELHGVKDTLSPEHEKYSTALKTVSEAFNEAIEFFNDSKFDSKEDWKKEAQNEGSTVYSKQIKQGKAFVLTVNFLTIGLFKKFVPKN
uniref:Uncharacterized protein n=1 Tax=Acrobeloides nanus TaxID=290746 RepID=A0A914CVW3_9BILA